VTASSIAGGADGKVMMGGGSPRCLRAMSVRSVSSWRVREASDIRSRRDSRVSIPSRAWRMSDWRRERERASRRRFSERVEREDLTGEDGWIGDGGCLAVVVEVACGGDVGGWDCCCRGSRSGGSGGLD
jgi:hypothetical protein